MRIWVGHQIILKNQLRRLFKWKQLKKTLKSLWKKCQNKSLKKTHLRCHKRNMWKLLKNMALIQMRIIKSRKTILLKPNPSFLLVVWTTETPQITLKVIRKSSLRTNSTAAWSPLMRTATPSRAFQMGTKDTSMKITLQMIKPPIHFCKFSQESELQCL